MKFVILIALVAVAASCVVANDKRESYNLISEDEVKQPTQEAINQEKVQSIAHNVREVRIINGREVEIADNIANKLVVVMDNLSKEATQVWGTVNEKLDQGWTGFKKMVEEAVKPNKP